MSNSLLLPPLCTAHPQATVCITANSARSHRLRRNSSRNSSSSGGNSGTNSSRACNNPLHTITSLTIPIAAHAACEDLDILSALGFTAEELHLDMQLVEDLYLANPYHNRHHGADVVSKAAKTL
jgi:hypothetical protein